MGIKKEVLSLIFSFKNTILDKIQRGIMSGMNQGVSKNRKRLLIGAALILSTSILVPNFALSFGSKSSDAKNISTKTIEHKKAEKTISDKKPSVFKSVVNKLIKKKPLKTEQNLQKDTPVATITGNIVFSIDDCVNFALNNDPNIKNYKSTQQIQKNAIGIAKSSYFPSLFGGTGYNITNTKYNGDRNDSLNNNYYGLNLGINQLIWDFGYTTAKINMNKFNYEAAGYDLENVVLNSVYNVKIAYTMVLAARANEDICERSVRINELNVERARAMYDVGLKSKIDVVNAEVYLTDSKINLLATQNTYQSNLIALNNSMYYINAPDYAIKDTETFNFQKNYSVKNEINVSYDRKKFDESSIEAEIKDGAILTSGIEKKNIIKTYSFKPFELTLTEAIQKAYENRPDLKSINLVRRASEEALKAIKRSYMPVINASAGYTMAKRDDYGSNAVAIYAGVSLPTINAMSIKNQIGQGNAYLDIATNNVDLLKKNIYFQVQNYYVNMKQLEKRIPLMSQKVQQTLENFELADGRYAVGLGNFLELQEAQTNYNNAQLAFVQAVFDYNQARFYLEKAIGVR